MRPQGPTHNKPHTTVDIASAANESRQYSRKNPAYSHAAARRKGRGKRILITVLVAVFVVVAGAGSAFAMYINGINSKLNTGDKTQDEISEITDVLKPTKSFDEPFYIMLIGSDTRETSETTAMDEPTGARSDTNIVVRVDPANDQATLVSIPRDTKIDIAGYGTNKFNAAYNFSGAAGAIREANNLLDIEISHYAEVNFDKLVDLVDAVGGVDVYVDERIDDWKAVRPEAGRNIVIEEGEQHLDGEEALAFARSRAYTDGDFTRTANQRKLIEAIVNKVLSASLTQLPSIIESAAECVTTDLSVTDIIALAQQFKQDGELTLYSAMLPSWTQTIDGISYVINDTAATKEMMELVEAGKDPSTIVSSGRPASAVDTGSSSSYYDSGTSTYNGGSTYYPDTNYGYTPDSPASSGNSQGDTGSGSDTTITPPVQTPEAPIEDSGETPANTEE